jgi:hypothetical protein
MIAIGADCNSVQQGTDFLDAPHMICKSRFHPSLVVTRSVF